jgi:hypothetical protein
MEYAMARAHGRPRPHILTDNPGSFEGIADSPWWHKLGRCAETDPDLFFPNKGEPSDAAEAICNTCPVKNTCLVAAIDTKEQHGVHGGKTVHGRKRMSPRALTLARRRADSERAEILGPQDA